MSSGGDSSPNYQVAKTDTAPWAGQQPYLSTGFNMAQSLLTSGQPAFYPGATYVPMSGDTSTALAQGENANSTMWNNIAGNGSIYNLLPQALSQTSKTLGGDYLNMSNPAFAGMLQNTMQQAQPAIDAAFAGGGRGISGARDAAIADAWASNAQNLGYQNYATERQNQIAAAGAAPGMVNAGLNPLQQLGQIGATQEGYAGQQLQDTLARWDAGQNLGWNNLGRYMAAVGGGSYGGQSTQMVPTTSNPWMTAAGLGTAGAGILGTLFGRNGVWPGGS
jgi:hypothetical protein